MMEPKKAKQASDIVIYEHGDMTLRLDANCYILTVKGENKYYTTLPTVFKVMHKNLIHGGFGKYKDSEKHGIENVISAIESAHEEIDRRIRVFMKQYPALDTEARRITACRSGEETD